jgi:thioredoxin-related protein
VLGVFDLSKDQIDIKEMSGVPSVLFFGPKKGLYQPVQYERRYEFEDVLKFINDQKIKDSKVEEKKIEAEKPIEEPREVFTAVLTG